MSLTPEIFLECRIPYANLLVRVNTPPYLLQLADVVSYCQTVAHYANANELIIELPSKRGSSREVRHELGSSRR